MRAMRQRFEHSLSSAQQDVLRALKLLASAGVQPYTHSRLTAVLADNRLFGRQNLHIRDCLTVLAEQAFISRPAPQDPIYPEPAYLRDAVTYVEARQPLKDFPTLADVLEADEDYVGLNLLGLTWGSFDPEQAITCFDKAIAIRADYVPAVGTKGTMLGALGQHEEAMKLFDLVGRLDPNDLLARYNNAVALNKVNRFEEALELTEELLELWPDRWPVDSVVWAARAQALRGLGQIQEALESQERALSLRQDNPEHWRDYAMMLADYEDRLEEALEAVDQSINLQPNSLDARRLKAIVLAALDRHDDAIDTIDQTINQWPHDANTWVMKGVILIKLGNSEEAFEWLCRAWQERNRLIDKSFLETSARVLP